MTHALNWFEIPVSDMDRAAAFYGAILDTPLQQGEHEGVPRAFLPYGEGGIGGALVADASMAPSNQGALVYLNGGEDLSLILDRVVDAGGSIAVPKTQFSKNVGHIAVFEDSEGNRVGLHSRQ